MTIWYLVFKIVALTHFGSELLAAEFATKAQCLNALVALQAGHPIDPYRGISADYQQRTRDFLFCTDQNNIGG